jgi:hypothetical protein
MKKIMILVVGLFLVFGMSGCFNDPTGPTPPATVYDPTPTATPEESVTPEETPVETETWRVEIEGDPGTTFEFECYKVYNTDIQELLPLTNSETDPNGDWKTTTFNFDATYRFVYGGKVIGTEPASFVINFYKNGVYIHTATVYPDSSGNAPDFGGSYN